MGWSPEKNLTERFHDARDAAKAIHPRWKLGSTYDGWSEALVKHSPMLIAALQKRFRQCMLMFAGPFAKRHGWLPIAVDGSRVEVPRTVANEEAFDCAGKPGTTPQLMLTVLFHMGLGLPWSFRSGPGVESEQAHLEQMIQELPEEALLVADAGFLSYELCTRMMRENRHFLLRVGGNRRLLTPAIEGCSQCTFADSQHSVWLWPHGAQYQNKPPLNLRLIVVGEGQQAVYLLTNVLDESRLSFEEASALYAMRWSEEVFFRSFKQTMNRGTLRSRSPRNCYAELAWNVLAIWLLGLLSVSEMCAAGRDPLAWSPAASRKAVRDILRHRMQRRGRLRLQHILIRCLKDTYHRTGPKATRSWPRKKKQKPPGPPKIQSPQLKEIKRAQRLGIEMVLG